MKQKLEFDLWPSWCLVSWWSSYTVNLFIFTHIIYWCQKFRYCSLWLNLICYCKLEDREARDKFIYKLHKSLMSLQLPLNFACLLCLAACWDKGDDVKSTSDSSFLCKSDVVCMLEANVAKRRQFLSTIQPSSLTSNCYACVLCYIFP